MTMQRLDDFRLGTDDEENSLQGQSRAELAEDCDSLIRMIDRRVESLRVLAIQLNRSAIPEWVWRETTGRIHSLLAADAESLSELNSLKARATRLGSLPELRRAVRVQSDIHRTRQAFASGLFVAADWHSPSVRHSVHPNVGPYQTRIILNHDDYKRDRHRDESAWESAWLREMVDNPAGLPLRALMTASGMAAFTTILAHVESLDCDGPVLMGAGTYHECRELLARSSLGGRIQAVREADAVAWREAVSRSPSVVFLDTLCNSAGLAVPDVGGLIAAFHRRSHRVLIVLDNTSRSVSSQPWEHLPRGSPVRLIVFESLTKYPQLGMDRAAGGVIVATSSEAEKLDVLRERLGTNVADVVVHQHPWPQRILLERRLRRIGRNTAVLADLLSRRSAVLEGRFRIEYPGSSSSALTSGSAFRGGFLAIESSESQPVPLYQRLIDSILRLARERRVPVCHGTSFGFDTTRVYLAAANAGNGVPFVRVAAGNEDALAARAVADVIADALDLTG